MKVFGARFGCDGIPSIDWIRRGALAIVATAWLGSASIATAQPATGKPAPPLRVLVVGNSLVYVNNVPALMAALAPPDAPIEADMLVAAGGDLAERWADGATVREISSGHWQVLVLQERGGVLACLEEPMQRDEAPCRNSVTAHKKLAAAAQARGMRVILLGTWGPDAIWQKQLSRSLRKLATQTGAESVDAGAVMRAFGQAHPDIPLYQDEGMHPSLEGSLLVAARLFLQISGQAPIARTMTMTAPLYPVRILPDPRVLASMQPSLSKNATTPAITAERLAPLLLAAAASP